MTLPSGFLILWLLLVASGMWLWWDWAQERNRKAPDLGASPISKEKPNE